MIVAPQHWTLSTIGELTLPVDKHRPEDEPLRPFQYVDISSIDNGRHTIVEPKALLGKDAPSRARQIVRAGDTVLSTVRTYLKNTAMVPAHLDEATASTGFSVLRADPDQIEPRFLYYRVLEQGFVSDLSAKQTGSSYPAVRDRDVRSMALSYPELDEQQRIVQAIDEQYSRLDAGVESIQRAEHNLDRLRRALFREAVRGKLAPSGVWMSDPEYRRLDEVAMVQLGRQRSPKHHSGDHMRPYLRAANVTWDGISLDDVKEMDFPPDDFERFRLQVGDILLNEASGSPDEVGKAVIWEGQIRDACFQNTLLRVVAGQFVDRKYLWLVFQDAARNGGFASVSRGVNIMHLGKAALAAWKIPMRPMKEQLALVAETERQLSVLRALERNLSVVRVKCAALRSAILAAAFSGQLTKSVSLRRETSAPGSDASAPASRAISPQSGQRILGRGDE